MSLTLTVLGMANSKGVPSSATTQVTIANKIHFFTAGFSPTPQLERTVHFRARLCSKKTVTCILEYNKLPII